jgi:hypothetical protein
MKTMQLNLTGKSPNLKFRIGTDLKGLGHEFMRVSHA